jgi:hypothetical protein
LEVCPVPEPVALPTETPDARRHRLGRERVARFAAAHPERWAEIRRASEARRAERRRGERRSHHARPAAATWPAEVREAPPRRAPADPPPHPLAIVGALVAAAYDAYLTETDVGGLAWAARVAAVEVEQ